MPRGAKTFTVEQRTAAFWAKVDKSGGPDACWIWRGAVTSKWGYGCFSWGQSRETRRVLGAHKLAWMLTNGDPGELCVLHKCDNRVCVNPAHFFLGTKKQNMEDCKAKGRHTCGEKNGRNVLTEEQARQVLKEYRFEGHGRHGKSNAKELAEKYGVRRESIVNIAAGRSWAHIREKS